MLLPRFAAAQKHAQMENAFWARALAAAKKKNSETGNRTLGICVTGRDVTNYTISDEGRAAWLAALGAFADFLGFSKKIFSAKSFWNVPFPTSLCAAAFGMFPRP